MSKIYTKNNLFEKKLSDRKVLIKIKSTNIYLNKK